MGKIILPENGKSKSELPRVLVGILAGSSIVDSGFAETYAGALIGNGELFWAEQCWIHGGIPDDSRNQIVEFAKKDDYDYVFFMDSDMVFPKGALAKLIASQAGVAMSYPMATVVGGMYVTRSDHRLNVYNWNEKMNSFEVKPVEPMSGTHRCDAVATGCQLIDMGVFSSIEYPYFEYWYRPHGPDGKKSKWSEDIVFAKKCYDKGIPHFVNSDVICPHIHSVLLEPVSGTEFQVRKLSGDLYYDESKVNGTTAAPKAAKKVS